MKILGNYYKFVQPQPARQQNNLKLKPALSRDVVCFRGFGLLNLPEQEVINKVKESIAPENFVGQGTLAEVYRIKDSDYCVKIPYLAKDATEFSFSTKLSHQEEVNHIVAKLGNGISIMKFFEGEKPDDYRNSKLYRIEFQEKIANMPIKSYTDLLHQIANAANNNMTFDFSGGNLIVDTKNNTLTAIDFFSAFDNPRGVKPLADMYSALTCYGTEAEVSKKIFDKIVTAGLEEFKPNVKPCTNLDLFDFEALCFKRCHDSYTENHEKIINEISRQIRRLKNIKKAEITDKTKSFLLEQNIRIVKDLLSKIH